MHMYRKWMAALLAAVLTVSLLGNVRAATSDELRQQLEALEEEEAAIAGKIEQLSQDTEENLQELKEIVAQKYNLDQQIALLQAQMTNINDQITAYSLLVAQRQEELDAAQAKLDALALQNRERIRAMEEQGDLSYWSVLFHSSSFSDLLDRISMVKEIQKADKRRLEELNTAAQAVEATRQALLQDKEGLETVRQGLTQTQASLDEKRQEADALVRKLWEKDEEYRQFLLEAEEEQERLMQQIADKEAELEEAEYQEWLESLPPVPETPSGEVQTPSSGGWIKPLRSYVLTSPFGMRMHPIYHVWKMHNGVDMAAGRGTPIYAARSGKITAASTHWSMGEYVTINHGDGFSSVYMHMEYHVVSAGEYVTAGQLIGFVGDSGTADGCHLHFGISYQGTYVNPMQYV